MKKKCSKFLSFMLTLALVIGLLSVMSLTACAEVQSVSFDFSSDTPDTSGGGYVFTKNGVVLSSNNLQNGAISLSTSSRFQVTAPEGKVLEEVSMTVNGNNPTWVRRDNNVRWTSQSGNVYTFSNINSSSANFYGDLSRYAPSASAVTVKFSDTIDVSGITLDSSVILMVSETKKLTATISPDNTTNKTVAWSTSSSDIATVNDGLITAVKVGTATITATATNGTADTADDKTATCTVTVHAHSLTNYQAYGATITATCSAEGCPLTDNKATLTISAPAAGGGAAVLSGDLKLFGVSSSNIVYSQRSGSTWGTETSTVPTGTGFFRASITVSKDSTASASASVTYGVSAISVASGITNGTVTAPDVATVSAEVPLTITPATGYELETITATTVFRRQKRTAEIYL